MAGFSTGLIVGGLLRNASSDASVTFKTSKTIRMVLVFMVPPFA